MKYIDKFQIDHQSSISDGPGGSIIVDAYITRIGVFDYGDDNKQLRSEEEVFKPESISSLNNCTLTLLHPKEEAVTPDNYKSVVVGHVVNGSVKRDGNYIRAKILIHDGDTIALVRSKEIKELSAGYEAETVEKAGTWDNESYNYEQTNILYNHVSLVPEGRAGPHCSLFIDHKDYKENMVKKITKDEAPVEEEKKEEAAKEEVKEDKKHSLSDSELNDMVKKMVADKMRITKSASKIAPNMNMDEAMDLTNEELMAAVITEVAPALDITEASPDFLAGAFEALAAKAPEEVREEVAAVEEEVVAVDEAVADEVTKEEEEIKKDKKVDTKISSARKAKLFGITDSKPAKAAPAQQSQHELLNKFQSDLHIAWKK